MTSRPSFLSRIFRFCEHRVDTLLGAFPDKATEEDIRSLPWQTKAKYGWVAMRAGFYATIVLTIFYFFPNIDTE